MNKADIEREVAAKSGLTQKQAKQAIEAFMASVKEGVKKDGKVQLVGFGSFNLQHKKARAGRNPKTGAEITIPAKDVVKFSPSF